VRPTPRTASRRGSPAALIASVGGFTALGYGLDRWLDPVSWLLGVEALRRRLGFTAFFKQIAAATRATGAHEPSRALEVPARRGRRMFHSLGGSVMTMKGVIPLALAVVMGCMHGGQGAARPATVSDADVGRLGPEQEGLVDHARQALDVARDALSRTNLRLQQAQNEQGIAKADQQAAEADQKVADAQQKVANDSRAPDALETARQLQEHAKARRQAADLHAEYASRLIAERKAEVQAAERQVDVAQARVEWSKLQALEQAGNPAATKYDPGRFQTAVNDAQGELDKAVQNARSLEAQANVSRQRWEDSVRRVQAQGGGYQPGTTGTGSGR
jgi:hypothetical protein